MGLLFCGHFLPPLMVGERWGELPFSVLPRQTVIWTFNREILAEVHVLRQKIEYNDMPPAFSKCGFFRL